MGWVSRGVAWGGEPQARLMSLNTRHQVPTGALPRALTGEREKMLSSWLTLALLIRSRARKAVRFRPAEPSTVATRAALRMMEVCEETGSVRGGPKSPAGRSSN